LHLADAEDLFMSRHRHRPAETRYCAPYSATPDRETATGRLLASSPAQALRARWPPRPCPRRSSARLCADHPQVFKWPGGRVLPHAFA
jgi:hypothetical protein